MSIAFRNRRAATVAVGGSLALDRRPDAAPGVRAVRCVDDHLEHVATGPSFAQAGVAEALLEVLLVRVHLHELVENAVLGPADDRNQLARADAAARPRHLRELHLPVPQG